MKPNKNIKKRKDKTFKHLAQHIAYGKCDKCNPPHPLQDKLSKKQLKLIGCCNKCGEVVGSEPHYCKPLQDKQECKHKMSGDMKSAVHCLKCGYFPSIKVQPPSSVQEWAKDFDKWFRKYNPPFATRTKYIWTAIYTDEKSQSKTDIKSFISNLLLKQKEEYRKAVKELGGVDLSDIGKEYGTGGYIQRNEVLKILK